MDMDIEPKSQGVEVGGRGGHICNSVCVLVHASDIYRIFILFVRRSQVEGPITQVRLSIAVCVSVRFSLRRGAEMRCRSGKACKTHSGCVCAVSPTVERDAWPG